MAKNRRYSGAFQLALPVPAGVVSGDPVLIGAALPGVALTDRDSDGEATVRMIGAFSLEVTAAAAMDAGDPVYIDAAALTLSDSNADVFFGYVLEAVAIGTATVAVKIGA